MKDKAMKILLIEDDINECNIYKALSKTRKDIKLVGITDSDVEGIKYLKEYKPEGIILDLELNKGTGTGTGFDFIEKIKELKLDVFPKIIVATNICSDSVYEFLHRSGVEFIFYKKQNNYSQENVINTLLLLRGYTNKITKDSKTIDSTNNNIADIINKELDLIGIATHLQGRKYLRDAILYIIENENNENKVTVVQFLVNKYKKSNSTISRAMQNSILHAWRISSLEDLNTYYTAKINYETGVPTPTEFIYYYADKIKKEL